MIKSNPFERKQVQLCLEAIKIGPSLTTLRLEILLDTKCAQQTVIVGWGRSLACDAGVRRFHDHRIRECRSMRSTSTDAYWNATGISSIITISMALMNLQMLPDSLPPLARTVRNTAIGTTVLFLLLMSMRVSVESESSVFWWSAFLLILAVGTINVTELVLIRWFHRETLASR
jgi:hypothetical protein